MNEKFNKNVKVEKLTNMFLSRGEERSIISYHYQQRSWHIQGTQLYDRKQPRQRILQSPHTFRQLQSHPDGEIW